MWPQVCHGAHAQNVPRVSQARHASVLAGIMSSRQHEPSLGRHIAERLRDAGVCVFPLADLPGGADIAASATAGKSACGKLLSKACASAATVALLSAMSSHLLLTSAPAPEVAAGLALTAGGAGAAYVRRAGGRAYSPAADAALDACMAGLLCVAVDILQHCSEHTAEGHVLASLVADAEGTLTSLSAQLLPAGAAIRAHVDASLLTLVLIEARDRALHVGHRADRVVASTLCEHLPGCGGAAPSPPTRSSLPSRAGCCNRLPASKRRSTTLSPQPAPPPPARARESRSSCACCRHPAPT